MRPMGKVSGECRIRVLMSDKRQRTSAADQQDGEQESCTGLLPDDTILQVAMVCRRWCRLGFSFLVFELVPPPIIFRPWTLQTYVQAVSRHASTISKLELNGLSSVTSQEFISLISSLPQLTDLSIVSCGNVNLQEIAEHFSRQLVRLDLHARHPPNVHSCFHNWVPLFDDSFVSVLQTKCPSLRVLDLDFSTSVTLNGLNSLQPSLAALTSLDLHSDELGWDDVQMIFSSCSELVHFSLVSSILSEQVPFPGHPVPANLISLRLYSNPHQSAPLIAVSQVANRKLEHLHAQSVFSSSWRLIACSYSNLKTLDISHSKQRAYREQLLTANEENVLCELARLLTKLERLALPTATDLVLIRLGMFCTGLQELRLQGLGPGTRPGPRVTDRGVMSLAAACTGLKVLSLVECDRITISSTRTFAFHCKELRVLHLHGCKLLDDAAIQVLFPSLNHCLKLLDVGACRRISRATLQHIQAQETGLRVLAVSRAVCKSSEALVRKMQEQQPRLHVSGGYCGYVWDGFYHANALFELG